MSNFNGPTIYKENGGRGVPEGDNSKVFGLVCGGVVTAGYATLGVAVELIQLSDAEDLGFTAAYDANNDVLVHYHISEHFRLCPDAVLILMVVAQGRTQTQMWDVTNTANSVKALIDSEVANFRVQVVGTVLNPDIIPDPYAPTITTGIDADVLTAVPKAQELINAYAAINIDIDGAVIEGRNFDGTAISSAKDFRTMASRNVHVVIASDPMIQALDAGYLNTAAVGTFLGSMCVRTISESAGSTVIENPPVDKVADEFFSLTDLASGRWEKASLSGGKAFKDLTVPQRTMLTDKGYIYAGKFPYVTGIFFNGGATCIAIKDDYSFGEYNRIWNECKRIFIKKSISKYNSKVTTNAAGLIDKDFAIKWQEYINDFLKKNITNKNHADKAEITIALNQNVISTSKVNIKMKVRPKGYARDIEAYIGFEAVSA